MPSTDTLADMLSGLSNASAVNHDRTMVPDSRFIRSVLQVLQAEGFIKSFRAPGGKGSARRIEVVLAYGPKRERLLNGARRISRPGRRVYLGIDDIKPMGRQLEISLLSTPQGIMTGAQAFTRKTGGEYLCQVW